MLTENEEKYLLTIPESKTVEVKPYDPGIKTVADSIIERIRSVEPALPVLFMGASALGIAGQNDLDIYVLCPATDFEQSWPKLTKVFGEPAKIGSSVKWEFTESGFPVELYLTDPDTPEMARQIKVFELLKNNPALLKEYETLKLAAGQNFREYMRKKYEFYNKILE